VEAAVARLLHVPEITAQVLAATRAHLPLADLRQQMTHGLVEDATRHWRAVVQETVRRHLQGEAIRAEVDAAVQRQVRTLQDEQGP